VSVVVKSRIRARIGEHMFYGEKDKVRKSLHEMQRNVCVYDGFFSEEPPNFCDCKYGYTASLTEDLRWSERNGCPELRTVVELLDKMTEEEYNAILSRK